MSDLTLDDAVATLLSSQKGVVVLRDKRGKKLGDFRPVIDQVEMQAGYRHPFTQEDLERAEQALSGGGGLPLSEVWKRTKGDATA